MSASSLHVPAESFTPEAKTRLFWISVFALFSAGMMFAIRGAIIKHIDQELFAGAAGEQLGAAFGQAFLGFAVSIVLSSPLLDRIGIGKAMGLSALLIIAGVAMVVCVVPISKTLGVERALSSALFIFGLGWGLVEATINPLIATVYADEKIRHLNYLHAWWPAGIIVGGLLAYFGDTSLNLPWRVQLEIPMIPTAIYGIACCVMKFPSTERTRAQISDSAMFKELLKPLFIALFLIMFLTATSELAPGMWLDFALSKAAHMPGILVLVYTSALMFIMRHFGGPIAHKLSPVGLLWLSSILACIGLYLISIATSPATAIGAATVWGTGVCFMWPTMLAMTSERFPRGGSLLLGLMGAAGMGSVKLVLPQLGGIYDKYANIYAHSHGFATFDALKAAAGTSTTSAAAKLLYDAQSSAGDHSFQANAIIPAVLIFVFAALWLYDRSKGGYKAVRLAREEALESSSLADDTIEPASV